MEARRTVTWRWFFTIKVYAIEMVLKFKYLATIWRPPDTLSRTNHEVHDELGPTRPGRWQDPVSVHPIPNNTLDAVHGRMVPYYQPWWYQQACTVQPGLLPVGSQLHQWSSLVGSDGQARRDYSPCSTWRGPGCVQRHWLRCAAKPV